MQADPDQLEQLLINLMRNAVDAALETGGAVRVGWQQNSHRVSVYIEDDGPGLANTSNLFVPFFTTKPQGSGIGLVLGPPDRRSARRHADAGTAPGARGARATVTLPTGNMTHDSQISRSHREVAETEDRKFKRILSDDLVIPDLLLFFVFFVPSWCSCLRGVLRGQPAPEVEPGDSREAPEIAGRHGKVDGDSCGCDDEIVRADRDTL